MVGLVRVMAAVRFPQGCTSVTSGMIAVVTVRLVRVAVMVVAVGMAPPAAKGTLSPTVT